MQIRGQVLNASLEKREMLNKDGVKAVHNILHILLLEKDKASGASFVHNIRSFDNPAFPAESSLPSIGSDFTTPHIKKYECYNGQVSEVMF